MKTLETIAGLVEGRGEEERRLALLHALCHDLGKLLAYDRVGNRWIDRRLPHERLSALMIAGLPEFYSELSSIQRETLLQALRYYHNPEEIPTTTPPLCHALLDWMHKADAIAYEEEKKGGRERIEEIKPFLWEAFRAALPHLNINRHRGGYPEGFIAGEGVFVLEHALRERSLEQLPQELQEKLPIRRPSGKLHPAWPLLVEVLREKGVLREKAGGRKPNPSALFNIVAGGTPYKCVVALSLEALSGLTPETVQRWKQSPPYEVRMSGGRDAG